MNKAVVFLSKTGHSKKIAQAIADEIHVHAENIKESPEIDKVDWLFIVGGIYGGASDPQMLNFVDQLNPAEVQHAVLITSCKSKKQGQDQVRAKLTERGIDVYPDEYICEGNFLFFGMGHPNTQEIRSAALFAKSIIRDQTEKSSTAAV